MTKEELKRLPFVVKAYTAIYPSESHCGICRLPWSAGGTKAINIEPDWGVFYVCPYCWKTRTKEEILKASVRGYMSQYESVSDRENFLKHHQLDEILYKIEQEYDRTHDNLVMNNIRKTANG